MIHVPFCPLDRYDDELKKNLSEDFREVLESGWFVRGRSVEQFENAFAAYCGVRYACGVGNGLDALTLQLRACIELGRLHPGDEVAVPSNTYIATVLAVQAAGLVPLLVDPDDDTCNISSNTLKLACTESTKAVIAVHLYGRLADMESINAFASSRGMLVFEDAAQAHGARFRDMRAGAFGIAAGFSFYPTKNLGALGDGGIVVTDDADVAEVVRALGNYGSREKYVNDFVGCNSRLDEVQAAILLRKLQYLDSWNKRRVAIAHRYSMDISNKFVTLQSTPLDGSHVYHVFPVFSERRYALQAFLKERGIETLVHYPIPPHLQKAYSGSASLKYTSLPVAERLSRTELSLPMSPFLMDDEVEYVIETVNSFED